ncbi:hypothetical protein ACYOEI_21140 [Singulisphaera rosea]
MSTATNDFENLLREALDKAAANESQANEDLVRLASQAADAVSKVTDQAATLELVPIVSDGDPCTTYQLQLRRDRSDAPASDLGIFRLSEAGYPIERWGSRRGWEDRPESPDSTHSDINDVNSNFIWLLSRPESKLVVLINSLRQKAGK